jgi:hydroxymethylpyrimidine pyrophosphatase-like HAD family hydrolase/GTPase SAR1 family protein
MRYVALAAGYDGTLARDGHCDERCVEALRSLAATGRKLILVTGRVLRELLEIFPEARLFDYVVAENGAVMYRPATRQSAILAQAPPEILLQELERRHVTPMSVGSSSITTLPSKRDEIRDALRKLGLDFQIVPNDGVLSVLPGGVDKASGVRAALKELGVSHHNLAAIGDGANDIALFTLAQHAAAVRNADPALKRVADRTTQGASCDGFLELAHDLIVTDLAASAPRRRIVLGRRDDSREISFAPCSDSLLICGPRGVGKTALCDQLLDQLLAQEYQCCVIGAEAKRTQAARAGVLNFGEAHEAPRLTDVLTALEQPRASVSINLAALAVETRPIFTDALMLQLEALHDRVGRPHCILINQAHCFLTAETASRHTRLAEITMIYATPEPWSLPAESLNSVKLIVGVGRATDLPPEVLKLGATVVQATTTGGADSHGIMSYLSTGSSLMLGACVEEKEIPTATASSLRRNAT